MKSLYYKNAYINKKLEFVLKNWSVLLIHAESEIRKNPILKNSLKQLFDLKAQGDEEKFIHKLQQLTGLRKILEVIIR